MEIIQVIILSIVEGVTELLPVSSTAHLSITSLILDIPQTDFLKTFEIGIQFGAVVSITIISFEKISFIKKWFWHVCVGITPIVGVGLFAYDFVKNILFESFTIIALALIIGGVLMICIERVTKHEESKQDISLRNALYIGIAQILALIPGVSRSAATVLMGRTLRISRETLVLFSFLMAIPVIGGAVLLDMYHSYQSISLDQWRLLLLGVLISGIVSYVVAKWFLHFVLNHSFSWFGWYRIALGVILLVV